MQCLVLRDDVYHTSLMRRTQLYLDEETARLLAAESRQRRTTVSALVRDAVARRYGRHEGKGRAAIIDRLAGVWSGRTDIASGETYVRRLRHSGRPERWGGGKAGKVPPRYRRHH